MTTVIEDENLQIDKLSLGPYGTNCYILSCRQTGESVLVDAPAEAEKILEHLRGLDPKYIIITHNHMDHLEAFGELKASLGVPVAVHPQDAGKLPSQPEVLLKDGDSISFGKVELKVLHTPGHTPGSICLLTGKYLISGDTIFPGGPGKTGSPADLKQIIESLTEKIFLLPEDTEIYPGHGDSTLVGKEKSEFEAFSTRTHDPGLCGDVLWHSS
jgi:glyoxylase-like metal-dependent hydrolase (beta-lactamase superfamily II)